MRLWRVLLGLVVCLLLLCMTCGVLLCPDVLFLYLKLGKSVEQIKKEQPGIEIIDRDLAEYEILRRAKETKNLIFGECHGVYRKDNDFVINILPELKKQGYNYLAIEISKDNPDAGHKFFIDYGEGLISRNDISKVARSILFLSARGWMDLIDAAKRNNMKIVFYDGYSKDKNERDRQAFDNLNQEIHSHDSLAKVVIYAGAFHLNKEPYIREDQSIKTMAYYLEKEGGGCLSVMLSDRFFHNGDKAQACDIVISGI